MGPISNEQIFELLEKISQDVQELKQDFANYKEEVEILKTSLVALENDNLKLKEKLLSQEELLRKRNILVFRIAETDNESLEQVVLQLLNNKLKINITINDIDNFYRIGNKDPNKARPILIKFTRELTIREVFRNVKKLKGTGISIALDLTQEKRADNKILYQFFKIAKEKQFSAKIIKNKLIINKDEYTVDTLKTLNKRTFLEPFVDKQSLFVNNSAPPTPTIQNTVLEDSSGDEDQPENRDIIQEKNLAANEERKQETKDIKSKANNTKNQISALQTPKGRTTRSGSTSSYYQQLQKKPTTQRK